jgi:hypothetical protein
MHTWLYRRQGFTELTLLTWLLLLNLASKMVASRVPCSSGMAAIASYFLLSSTSTTDQEVRNNCSEHCYY